MEKVYQGGTLVNHQGEKQDWAGDRSDHDKDLSSESLNPKVSFRVNPAQ